MQRIQQKGHKYLTELWKYRIPKLYFRFFCAVLLFYGQAWLLGIHYSTMELISALSSWGSIGNSNWYVTAILLLYLLTYFVWSSFLDQRPYVGISATWIGTAICYLVLKFYRRNETYYYDTLFCYPAGMLYAIYLEDINSIVQANNRTWCASLLLVVGSFSISYVYAWHYDTAIYLFWRHLSHISFALSITLLLMKVHWYNPFLVHLGGKNMFAHYILQRIVMRGLIWKNNNINSGLFVSLSVPAIVVIAWVFTTFLDYIELLLKVLLSQ